MQPLALYIHWPFCKAKCPYCDFNSHVRDAVEQQRWRAALLREMDWTATQLGERQLTSIFFGGGTPSLMPPRTVAALIDAACAHWQPIADLEITLEANPTSSEATRFQALHDAGVSRVSMGIQSLEEEALRFLGRQHSVSEALNAFEAASAIFARTSFDLIYALPGQTLSGWEAELRRALSYAGRHLSLYQLTIEPGTQFFHAHKAGRLPMPEDDHAAALYQHTQTMMEAAGLPAYEISNHAAPGEKCRHNLAYWRTQDYAGIGPGAHGRVEEAATLNIRSPEAWLQQVEDTGHGQESALPLTAAERAEECLLMGLRLREGVSLAHYEALAGQALDTRHPALQRLEEAGVIILSPSHLRVNPEHWLLLNRIIAEIVTAQPQGRMAT